MKTPARIRRHSHAFRLVPIVALLSMLGLAAYFAAPAQGAQLAASATYYVDCQNGNDSNTGVSEAAAWKTLPKANSAQLNPGDTLLLRRGCTWTGPLSLSRSGTAGKHILVSAYGTGTLPLIQNAKTNVSISGSYITIEQLATRADAPAVDSKCKSPDGAPQAIGFMVGFRFEGGAAYNTLRSSFATELARGVLISVGAHHNLVFGNTLTKNNMMSRLTPAPANADDSGAQGMDVEGSDNEIAYNTISGHNACSYDYGTDGSAIEIWQGKRNYIHHNRSIGNKVFSELGNPASADNFYAYNLITSDLATSTVLTTRGANSSLGPVAGTKFFNNTAYLTGSATKGVVCAAGCTSSLLTLRNNILVAQRPISVSGSAPVESNNIFWSVDGNPAIQGITISPTSKRVDPQLRDPAAGALDLNSTSPAINAGVDVGYDQDFDGKPVPVGPRFDIGAYEFGVPQQLNPNLLKNDGFELDANADSRPDSWTSNSHFTRSSATAQSGRYSGLHRATDNSGYTIRQTISGLRAGNTYVFSGYVKIPTSGDAFTFRLQVRWRNASNAVIRTDTLKSFTDDTKGYWYRPWASRVAPAGTTNAQVQMAVSSLNATIYVDSFAFRLAPKPTGVAAVDQAAPDATLDAAQEAPDEAPAPAEPSEQQAPAEPSEPGE